MTVLIIQPNLQFLVTWNPAVRSKSQQSECLKNTRALHSFSGSKYSEMKHKAQWPDLTGLAPTTAFMKSHLGCHWYSQSDVRNRLNPVEFITILKKLGRVGLLLLWLSKTHGPPLASVEGMNFVYSPPHWFHGVVPTHSLNSELLHWRCMYVSV